MSKSIATNRELWKKLYQLYLVEQIPVEHIAARLGYSDGTVIIDICRKFGMPSRRRIDLYVEEAKMMFTPEQEQILLGSILGDGCVLKRSSRNPIWTETHSIHQIDYLSWKQTKMYPFIKDISIGHKGTVVYMKSRALPQLGFYRGVFYPKDKKIIPVEALEWIDDLAVAVWYMDDGGISKEEQQVKIATCGFDTRTNGMLQGWLAEKYKIHFEVRWHRNYPSLVLQKGSNKKFFSIIEPYIVPSMRYKLGH